MDKTNKQFIAEKTLRTLIFKIMTTKIYYIKYDANVRENTLPSDYYDITENNISELREFNALRSFCRSGEYKKFTYSGIVSQKFTDKTGLAIADAVKLVDETVDVILFHPFPLELRIQNDFLHLAEYEHPGITTHLKNFTKDTMGIDIPVLPVPQYLPLFCHCSFFVGNQNFWDRYSEFIFKVDELLQQGKLDYLFATTDYNLTIDKQFSLPFFPFVFERSFAYFLYKERENLSIKNIAYLPNFNPVSLFAGEKILIILLERAVKSTESFLAPEKARDIATRIYFGIRKLCYRIKNSNLT